MSIILAALLITGILPATTMLVWMALFIDAIIVGLLYANRRSN